MNQFPKTTAALHQMRNSIIKQFNGLTFGKRFNALERQLAAVDREILMRGKP